MTNENVQENKKTKQTSKKTHPRGLHDSGAGALDTRVTVCSSGFVWCIDGDYFDFTHILVVGQVLIVEQFI